MFKFVFSFKLFVFESSVVVYYIQFDVIVSNLTIWFPNGQEFFSERKNFYILGLFFCIQ